MAMKTADKASITIIKATTTKVGLKETDNPRHNIRLVSSVAIPFQYEQSKSG